MLLSGIGRRKVNILWAINHPLLLGCLLYIIFQLIGETQSSSEPDKNLIPARVEDTKRHSTVDHGLALSAWHRGIKNNSAENLLTSINSKVDKINENFERLIKALKPDNTSKCNSSKIFDNSSAQIGFALNNVSISNSDKNSDKTDTPSEETEIELEDKSSEPGNLYTNEREQSKRTTKETLPAVSEKISEEILSNSRESKEHPSEQISETLTYQNSISNETSTSTIGPSSLDNMYGNVSISTEYSDDSTPPRNDDSNKLVPTIPTEMADEQVTDEMEQSNDFSNSLSVNSQPNNSTNQQKPLDSYRMSEESSSTPKYQTESSSTFQSVEIPKATPQSASFITNTNSSSSQVENLDPGYTLKRIVLQGVDKIHYSLNEHTIQLPQNNKADMYLFYYIPGAMNLHRSGNYIYLPNEDKQYEGGYLKHRYTPGKSSNDYSAHSLDHLKLMRSYAKSKKSASKVSTPIGQSLNKTSDALSVNISAADQKPKNEDSQVYYFVAPYFHNNHTFGSFRLSSPEFPSVLAQTSGSVSVEGTSEEPREQIVGKGKRFKRDTRSSSFSDSADETECLGDVKWCADRLQCVKKIQWCNQIVDCLDKSDELNCTCRERMDEEKICDHYIDCPDGEDEKGCFGCPADAFSCDREIRPWSTAKCIHISQRCDHRYDCEDGSDELDCELLSDSVDIHENFHTSYTSGYLHRNYMGRWYPACIEIHSEHVWGIQACRAELGFNVKHVEAELLLFHDNYVGKFVTHNAFGEITFVDTCKYPGYAVHVKCPSIPCGKRTPSRYHPPVANHPRFKRIVSKSRFSDSKHELVYKVLGLILNERSDEKVVGGANSGPGDWPWLIALYMDGELHCGGAIIDDTWILTAGHCVYRHNSHFFEVYAGRLRRLSFSPNEQLRIVTHTIIHPQYSHADLKNDLALLKLNEPLKFNRWVRPLCLPADRAPWGPAAGTFCYAAGWGSIWEKGSHPDNLREVKLPIRARCKGKADREGEEICAGYEQGGYDTCQGDSGGPLLCNPPGVHDQWYVAGVVSHGEGCARAHEPGAYTRVALFIPWIAEHTDNQFLTSDRETLHKCPNMKCSKGGRCVGRKQICDGIVDCLDAEDEYESNCVYSEYEQRIFNDYRRSSKYVDEIRRRTHVPANNGTELPSSVESSNTSRSRNVQQFQSTSQEKESPLSVPDTSSNPDSSLNDEPLIEKRETSSYFTCLNLLQNIPLEFYCDTEVDCEDGTDEINCSCADYLKVTNESLICDGIIHCYDLSDEKYCPDYNCSSDEFFCFKSRSCIPKELVCDGKKHCFHGEDENRCYWPISISSSTPIQNQFDIFGVPLFSDKGVLAYNDHAVWKWSCFPEVEENEIEVPKTIQKLARRLGFKQYKRYSHFMVFDDEVLNKRQQNYCPGLLVDFAVAHVEDESLIPWRVNIFVNGILTCLGVLIRNEWVLADQSCCLKLNTSTDYIVAVFGSDEKLSKLIRTYEEQIILVDKIRCDEQANTALLHLHEKTRTTEKTKSLGIVSTQEVLELKQNYLLILEDTQSTIFELKVLSNCPVASSCYKMKYNIDFCSNSNSTLKFEAVISLSRKKEWIFSGIVVESLTCLTSETVMTINIPQAVSSENNTFVNITEFYYRGHRVFRCSLGNQISWENVCDGRKDCRENEDEIDLACQEKQFLIERKFIKPSCRVDEFECKNGRCVSKSKICNSINDCGDNTDEPDTCSNFNCAAYLNLTNPQKLCDSQQDCEDKSDENIEICPSLRDLPSSFRCNRSNSWILLDFVCDGERDCEYGEDEEECISYKVADNNGTEGTIWMRSRGKWKQQCFTPSEMVAFDVQHLCNTFGYTQATNNRTTPATSYIYTRSKRVKLNEFIEVTLEKNAEKQVNSTEYCEYLYLSCG